MQLYLLRHGIADPGFPDRERALTAEGRRKLKDVLRVAKAAGVAPGLIVSSPLKRAVQTAEIAAELLGYRGKVATSSALEPDSHPSSVWDEVRQLRHVTEVVLVGHEPLFGQLFAHLLGVPSLVVDFKKGALARIDVEGFGAEPKGSLRWLLPPRLADHGP
jgi:phosphohistidine phosphatase